VRLTGVLLSKKRPPMKYNDEYRRCEERRTEKLHICAAAVHLQKIY